MCPVHRSLLCTVCTQIALWSVLFVSLFHSVPALATVIPIKRSSSVEPIASAIVSCLQYKKSVDRCNKEIAQYVSLIDRMNHPSRDHRRADAGVITIPTTGAVVVTGIVVTVVLSVWFACGVNQICQSEKIASELRNSLSFLNDPKLKATIQKGLARIIQNMLSSFSVITTEWQQAQKIISQLYEQIKKHQKELATLERSIRPKASGSTGGGGSPQNNRPSAPYKGKAGNQATVLCEQLVQEIQDLNLSLQMLARATQSIVDLQQKQYDLATGKESVLREILEKFEEQLGNLYNQFSKDNTVSRVIQNAINQIWKGKGLQPPNQFRQFLTDPSFAWKRPYSTGSIDEKLVFLNHLFEMFFLRFNLSKSTINSSSYNNHIKNITVLSGQVKYSSLSRFNTPLHRNMMSDIEENRQLLDKIDQIRTELNRILFIVTQNGICTNQQFGDVQKLLIKLLDALQKLQQQLQKLTVDRAENMFKNTKIHDMANEAVKKISLLRPKLLEIRKWLNTWTS